MDSRVDVEFPEDVRVHLNEIAERLWSDHAAIMVGAGFTRNAVKAAPNIGECPTWQQLGNTLYKKLHGREPTSEDHYLNALKLAEQVQAAYGRPALDQLLRSQIADRSYHPGRLHERLLNLPWVDVFTTNYDTLLERAAQTVVRRRFEVIVSKDDLVYSTRPRIVKLHGSFPSNRPFVISEEDYRRYPMDYAPFVNTVQQSLLENTLCLLGFSGDDPNFLNWIGWVRDNLGATNAPKIYLIGLLRLSSGERMLLEKRNVVPVDLASTKGLDRHDHQRATTLLFDYLEERRPAIKAKWAPSPKALRPTATLVPVWQADRLSYPKWVITPWEERETLFRSVQASAHECLKETLNPHEALEFLFELNWRLERALCPIPNDVTPYYEATLARSNPFGTDDATHATEMTESRSKEAKSHWFDLNLALLRHYREEGRFEAWTELHTKLMNVVSSMSAEQRASFTYERILKGLFALDFADFRAQLEQWQLDASMPAWEAKKAGLLAEIGLLGAAEALLRRALSSIRSYQHLTPVLKDYEWPSQESYVMLMLQAVEQAGRFLGQSPQSEASPNHFSERWNQLKAFDCDPWNELTLFDAQLTAASPPRTSTTRRQTFDLGRETVTHHLGGVDEMARTSYAFLRFCENTGLPFRMGNLDITGGRARNAAARITPFSSTWALITLLRVGDERSADDLFSRDMLAKLTVESIDKSTDLLLSALRQIPTIQPEENDLLAPSLGFRIRQMIPELLSRLCLKCSEPQKRAIFEFLKDTYSDPRWTGSDGIRHLINRLLSFWNPLETARHLQELVEFPLLDTASEPVQQHYPDPFAFLSDEAPGIATDGISEVSIQRLIDVVASGSSAARARAILRLHKLQSWALLTKDQLAAFGTALWTKVDRLGFPVDSPFHRWAVMVLPAPENIDVTEVLKNYLLGEESWGRLINGLGTRSSIAITRGEIRLCSDLLSAVSFQKGALKLTGEDCNRLVTNLSAWWNAGKEGLREEARPMLFGNVSDEYRARYRHLVDILAYVIAPRLREVTHISVRTSIEQLLHEASDYGLPCLRAQAACAVHGLGNLTEVANTLEVAVLSRDEERIVDAFAGMRVLLADREAPQEGIRLLGTLVEQVKWRRTPGLSSALHLLQGVVVQSGDRVSTEMLSDIGTGLRALAYESDPRIESSLDISERLRHRVTASALAAALYKRYATDPNLADVLSTWRTLCGDREEFADVRAAWHEITN